MVFMFALVRKFKMFLNAEFFYIRKSSEFGKVEGEEGTKNKNSSNFILGKRLEKVYLIQGLSRRHPDM